jgi:hypothetical protein
MKLTSTAFQNSERMHARFTFSGDDRSPPLSWSGAPDGARSFALLCDDPDAPSPRRPAPDPWVHWVLFNIPAGIRELPEGVDRKTEPRKVPGAKQGRNSWPNDSIGYRGPAPPPGSGPHRYVFRLYALDAVLDLEAGATQLQLLTAMKGHVLAEDQLIGVYER